MDRQSAHKFTRDELNKYGLKEWGIRLSTNINDPFLGLCIYKDKVIILNAHHIDIHPHDEIIDTIKHEVAHALTPGHRHDSVWADKARELGCTNTLPCSHLDLPAHVIDAIRSGDLVECITEEETHVIRRPKYVVTQLQDKCPECGKVAKELFSQELINKNGDTVRLITLECFHIVSKTIPKGTPFQDMVSNDWNPAIKSCKHVWNKNRCDTCGEFKLFNFQVNGARAAEYGLSIQKGFGIFDDMGLGKTVQVLALIKFHLEYCPTLYVVKSAIKFNWFKQVIRWLGPAYMPQVISTSKDFIFSGLKSYIIAYDLLRRFPREKLEKLGIKLVVLDECQQIKNPDSSRTQEVRKLVSNPTCKVLPLSGTPWKNRGDEFFPVLNMISPTKFYSHQGYIDNWVEYYWQGNKRKMGGIKRPDKFREFTKELLIRREYNEVMDEFPDINRMKMEVQLDELSQSTYDDEVSEFVKWYNEALISGMEEQLSGIQLLGKMSRMRHITGLAKIPATIGFVEEFVEDTDRKLVIFVHHKDVGELLYNELKETYDGPDSENRIPILKMTAELKDSERFEMQENFNKLPRAIMVASTLASGEGIDLQTCADAILHERQWNPQNEDQAAPGRFRRIGQLAKAINITVIEADGTIDEHIDSIVEGKRKSFHDVMNKSKMTTWSEGSFAQELAAIIVAKHKAKHVTNITKACAKRA